MYFFHFSCFRSALITVFFAFKYDFFAHFIIVNCNTTVVSSNWFLCSRIYRFLLSLLFQILPGLFLHCRPRRLFHFLLKRAYQSLSTETSVELNHFTVIKIVLKCQATTLNFIGRAFQLWQYICPMIHWTDLAIK